MSHLGAALVSQIKTSIGKPQVGQRNIRTGNVGELSDMLYKITYGMQESSGIIARCC